MKIIIPGSKFFRQLFFLARARRLGARSLLRAVYNWYIISVSRIVVRVKEQETLACMIRR